MTFNINIQQYDLRECTQELIELQNESAEDRISGIIRLLTISKNKKHASDWNEPNHVSDALLRCLRLMLVDSDRQLRVQACRAVRYVTWNFEVLEQMKSLNMPIFMMRCLEREDNKYLWERLQSLKWIRHLIDNFATHIPRCVVISLIAIAQNGKDDYRRICLDSLRELCIKNPEIIAQCNGFKLLIDSILQHQLSDISNSLVLTILYILDHPQTRRHLRPSIDIQRLLAPFMGMDPYKYDSGLSKKEIAEIKAQTRKKREVAEHVLMTMLKSITGIFYLGADSLCLKTLITLMKLPNSMKGIQWARKTMFRVLETALAPLSNCVKLEQARGPNLIVNYVCLILMAYIRNGLIECLVDVGMRSDLQLAPLARTLLQRIQFLAAKYLPPDLCSKICGIPTVVSDASMFEWDSKNQRNYKSQLHMTVQRNFATMMISELTEPAAEDDDVPGMFGPSATNANTNDLLLSMSSSSPRPRLNQSSTSYISSRQICHKFGPMMDLNSTFIRYRYMMDRNIPLMMFQDHIPYHSHRQQTKKVNTYYNRPKHDDSHDHNNHNSNSYNSVNALSDDNEVYDFTAFSFRSQRQNIIESLKSNQNASYSEKQILQMLNSTQVLGTKDFMLWSMEQTWKVLNGPLWHLPNLLLAMRNKFMKRLIQTLKPSRQFFSHLKWTPATFRHAQCACQLFRLLTSCDEGCNNQFFRELVAEIFECLKDQLESNLMRRKPVLSYTTFSRYHISNTLSRVYIILIGILSESPRGLKFFTEHKMATFLFPLTRKEMTDLQMHKNRVCGPNDYLLRLIAFSLDYTTQQDFRMLFSQWIASGSYYLRKTLISHLELLYRAQMPRFDEWSINVLAVLLKREQRLALTALKVLEKINLSQGSVKSRSFLIDLINTQPTDSVVGIYGQFLFIKMLSTTEGLKFLQKTNWLEAKRREWASTANKRYTNMLETALVLSVNNETNFDDASGQTSAAAARTKPNLQSPEELKQMSTETEDMEEDNSDSTITWLPYHLIHENRSDEEELYNEYLTHLPWTMSITIVRASGQEVELATDCFFDYNCFLPKSGQSYPTSLGPGVHAIVLDKYGCPKPFHVDKSSRIRMRLNMGDECLDTVYHRKTLQKTVSMLESTEYSTYASIVEDQAYFFFENPSVEATRPLRTQTMRSPLTSPSASSHFMSKSTSVRGPISPNSRLNTSTGDLSRLIGGPSNINSNERSLSAGMDDDKHTSLSRVFLSLREVQTTHSLVRPLPHFFGELAKTKEGCDYIQKYKDLDKFIAVVQAAKVDQNAYNDHLDLRACLWAIGMIGSSATGLQLLNTTTIVDDICDLTKTSPTLSIRGTCLYVLGLLSRSKEGMDQLRCKGFDFPADNLELDLAVAIPVDIDSFFAMGETNYVQSWAANRSLNKISVYSPPELARPAGNSMKPMDPNALLGKQGHTEQTVLAHISALCNNVTQKSSASALHKLRSKKPSVFSNPLLFREALKVMNAYQFKLAARRFILFTIFDQVLLDETTIDLFDESLQESVLPFQSIREWRYLHKQSMIEQRNRNIAESKHRSRHKMHTKHNTKARKTSAKAPNSAAGSASASSSSSSSTATSNQTQKLPTTSAATTATTTTTTTNTTTTDSNTGTTAKSNTDTSASTKNSGRVNGGFNAEYPKYSRNAPIAVAVAVNNGVAKSETDHTPHRTDPIHIEAQMHEMENTNTSAIAIAIASSNDDDNSIADPDIDNNQSENIRKVPNAMDESTASTASTAIPAMDENETTNDTEDDSGIDMDMDIDIESESGNGNGNGNANYKTTNRATAVTFADRDSNSNNNNNNNTLDNSMDNDNNTVSSVRSIANKFRKISDANTRSKNAVKIRSKSFKKPPPRPWPPVQYTNNNINSTGNHLGRGGFVKKARKSVGYEDEFADSPTRQARGPNPLECQTMLEEEQMD